MLAAVEVAEAFEPGTNDSAHWEALARFREALDPGVRATASTREGRVSLSDFLSGLEVRAVDQFSLSPNSSADDFEVVPFSSRRLDRAGPDDGTVGEDRSELSGEALRTFQSRIRSRGALPAYLLGSGSFVVVDRSAAPALRVMAEMQRAPREARAAFIRNPRPKITEAVEADLRTRGLLSGLTPSAEEDVVEQAANMTLIETKEYSERVRGVKVFERLLLDLSPGSGTTWLPEVFERRIAEAISALPQEDLERLGTKVAEAIEAGRPTVDFDGNALTASPPVLGAINAEIEKRKAADRTEDEGEVQRPCGPAGPIVIDTKDNFTDLGWAAKLNPRTPLVSADVPAAVRTPLKNHQVESLSWQIAAWTAGLPGVLNADEQGLGKTLQTISFLVWLKSHLAQRQAKGGGPVLVVAPTSLLETWEGEVARHVAEPGLGHLVRLYGSATASRKLSGARGMDIESGEAKLDFAFLHEAMEENRAHRFWMLTTYTTLTNYQHSFARIPFSAAVFDEIQALKNPDSLRAHAARAINADFRIGLTGTPIENSAVDLWAIMDQIAPGALDTLKDFRKRYATPDEANMAELHGRVFKSAGSRPPLALRRLKDEVARDLPEKARRLHPRLMPPRQTGTYEEARIKLANGGPGAALKMLHHIRSVSVHPALDDRASDADFIYASARLTAVFDILRKVRSARERALVFIEHRQMQYRFIELAKIEFGLPRIDLINGDTPIPQRQAIVDRFQRHLEADGGFDLLVLGPKAAGTGLTLTAATHVIHLSRWWNPAVEEQCNDRVHRIGQARPVTVHVPMAIHPQYREDSFDCLLQSLMGRKRRLATSALWPMGDTDGDVDALQKGLGRDQRSSTEGDPLRNAVAAMFARDGLPPPVFEGDGSVKVGA
jgi:superfamily II DNA or RNA helicase